MRFGTQWSEGNNCQLSRLEHSRMRIEFIFLLSVEMTAINCPLTVVNHFWFQQVFLATGSKSPSHRCHKECDSNKYIRAAVFVRVTAVIPNGTQWNEGNNLYFSLPSKWQRFAFFLPSPTINVFGKFPNDGFEGHSHRCYSKDHVTINCRAAEITKRTPVIPNNVREIIVNLSGL